MINLLIQNQILRDLIGHNINVHQSDQRNRFRILVSGSEAWKIPVLECTDIVTYKDSARFVARARANSRKHNAVV